MAKHVPERRSFSLSDPSDKAARRQYEEMLLIQRWQLSWDKVVAAVFVSFTVGGLIGIGIDGMIGWDRSWGFFAGIVICFAVISTWFMRKSTAVLQELQGQRTIAGLREKANATKALIEESLRKSEEIRQAREKEQADAQPGNGDER